MIGRSVARRYVRAALDVADEADAVASLQRQLWGLQEATRAGRELPRLLRHPTLPRERKLAALESVLGEPPIEAVARLVELLVHNDRVEALSLAGEVLQELTDERAGVVRAHVTTALPLSEQQTERLRAALSHWRGAPIELELNLDPGLIGGLVIRIGDRVLDASIQGRLLRVTRHLAGS